MPPPATHRLHAAGGCTLSYLTAGRGDPVVLLHGWPQSSHEWTGVLPQLAAQYQVIAPDLRGMGDSTRPLGGYDTRTVAADIASLLASLGVRRPRIVGHDLGGPVGFMLAADAALEVRQFVFMEAPLYGVEAPGVAEKLKQAWHIPFFAVPHVAEFLIARREVAFVEYFMKEFAYDKSVVTSELAGHYARIMQRPGALVSGLAYYRAAGESAGQIAEARKRGKLAMPVLALGGAACLGDAPLSLMREVASDVTGGTVEACGHWMAEERPDEVASRLLDFFARG